MGGLISPTRRHKTYRVAIVCLVAILMLGIANSFLGCGDDANPTSASCSSCGSGDVYWDTNADRCRDNDNGQFVKSCCCGH